MDNTLLDPSNLDAYAPDHLNRQGPKHGIFLSHSDAAVIFSRLFESIATYKVSTRGYNNRLYFITSTSGKEYVVKVCGRYWKRLKTETEVIGLKISREYTHISVPKILAWDSTGEEFGVEYTIMDKIDGTQLGEIWANLSLDIKKSVIGQIAEMVVAFKTQVPETVLPRKKIGNFVALGDRPKKDAIEVEGFEIGATLEGLGPWTSYKAYLRTLLENQLKNLRSQEVLKGLRDLLPRIELLLKTLDDNENIIDTHQFVFTHGDLNIQNILVTLPESGGEVVPKVVAILDWEWSGIFPAEEEYFISFDFLSSEDPSVDYEPSLASHFFDILEAGGVETPRTIKQFEQRKALYDLKENIAPWYLLDHVSPDSEEVRKDIEKARGIVIQSLEKVGY